MTIQEPLLDYTALQDEEIDTLCDALMAYYIFCVSVDNGKLENLTWALEDKDKQLKIYRLQEKLRIEQVRRGYGRY